MSRWILLLAAKVVAGVIVWMVAGAPISQALGFEPGLVLPLMVIGAVVASLWNFGA